MPIRLVTITRTEELEKLRDDWEALAQQGGPGALFRSPTWLLTWWRAYRDALGAEPLVFVGYDADKLVCIAPYYTRVSTDYGPKLREVRLMGDAGLRPVFLGVLIVKGYEEQLASALSDAFKGFEWDVLDLEPVPDVSRLQAFFVQRMDATGKRVRTTEAGGATRVALNLAGFDLDEVLPEDPFARAYTDDSAALRKGVAALRRLSRLEWADLDQASPIAEDEATRLLSDIVGALGPDGRVRLARLDDDTGEAIAAALVVDDDDRAVVLALAVDPEHVGRGAATRLLAAEARAAIQRGRTALDVVIGGGEHEPPPLPTRRKRTLRLRIYNASPAAAIARAAVAVRRRVTRARVAPASAAASARAAWSRIRTAASAVASYGRFHLYRGELWVRGVAATPGLALSLLTEAQFEALAEHERSDLVHFLELDETYCRHKWKRGDVVVLARIDGRPAGIAWCARAGVHVPELDRQVRPGPHECYIHDVFVAPKARGRAVAPSMLEYLAHELRQHDVYRSWALIEPSNVASVRAFEKAAYTPVADIVYARMANVERVTVRPPDPEAKQLLGLP